MTPSEWPLRLVPRRTPPLSRALPIALATFAGAVLIRGLMLGFDNATGLSATDFPALILATLYAGPRWGWGLLAAVITLVGFVMASGANQAMPEVQRPAEVRS